MVSAEVCSLTSAGAVMADLEAGPGRAGIVMVFVTAWQQMM
jgi:hypothetical protein